MSEYKEHLGLLPAGFVDLMPEEAEQEAKAIQILMDVFAGHGYERIKPPLIEFEDSLLAPGPGAALASDTFRLMDPVSHRMMGIRADITPQIARIICTRLPPDVAPIRLAYANDVLRTKAGQVRSSRQFTQVGCEIIRDDSAESTAEIGMLALLGLKALGIENITLDFTLPRLFDQLCTHFGVSEEDRELARAALRRRERDGLKAVKDQKFQNCLLAILEASGAADKAVAAIEKQDLSREIKDELEKFKAVIGEIGAGLKDLKIADIRLTYDPFETKGFEYQNGIAFTLFAGDIRGELGRGGHYAVSFGTGKNASQPQKALGFTLYMDTIRAGLKAFARAKLIAVDAKTGWAEIENLRREGWRVIRLRQGQARPENCRHVYRGGKIIEE